MIDSITQIGKVQWDSFGYRDCPDDLLKIFTMDPSDDGRYNKAMIIEVEERSDGTVNYIRVNSREYDNRDKERYLYRTGSSRGTDFSPTAKITEPKKTLSQKVIKRIDEVAGAKLEDCYRQEQNLLKKVKKVLEENHAVILKEMDKLFGSKSGDDLFFVSVSILKDGLERLPGDISVFKKVFVDDCIKSMYFRPTGSINTRVDKGVCSVCFNTDTETYGLASPFTFYTIDKPGYISGGFNKKMVSYNYPVCRQCAMWLNMGKDYLDNQLSFRAFGKSYYVIPSPFDEKDLPYILRSFSKLRKDDNFSEFRDKYLSREERVFERLGQENNICMISFVFFREDNSSFRILLQLEDVLPSRLNKIFSMLLNINESDFFSKFPVGKDSEISVHVNFKWLADLLNEKVSEKYFLELFGDIIKSKKIDYHFLMEFITGEISSLFNNEDVRFKSFTIASYGFLLFLNNLGLLNFYGKGGGRMNIPKKNLYEAKNYENRKMMFEDFFADHQGFFDSPEKKAVFMIGFLSQKLINIQAYKSGGNTPFRARLKGLKLTQRDIKRLFHEIVNKLEEYKSNYYKSEEGLCAEYLVEAGDNWDMLPEDISFFAALGMSMVHCFKYDEKEYNEEE